MRPTIILIVSVLALGLFIRGVSSQSQSLHDTLVTKAEATISVHAKGRGFPHISFTEGKELAGGADNTGSQPTRLVSADFNSDGIADLVTTDSAGGLRLYRGNAAQLYPNSPQVKATLVQSSSDPAPFDAPELKGHVSTAPDFLSAGDFNADGHQDILTATYGLTFLSLLAGNGAGIFAPETQIKTGGAITASVIGEIGRRDGQTDLAVVVADEQGAQLLVYEHPEGAFKYRPEVFKLSAAATELAVGNLDDDSYGDIALAAGDTLTIVHWRGQAYPLDMLAEDRIERPAAFVQTRQFGFRISSLAIGNFGARRGASMAILADHGVLHVLEASSEEQKSAAHISMAKVKTQATGLKFVPTGVDASKYAVLAQELPNSAEEAKRRGMMVADLSLAGKDIQEYVRLKSEKAAEAFSKLSRAGQTKATADDERRAAEERQQSRAAFAQTLAPRPASLDKFELRALASDARLSQAANSAGGARLVKARVSDSGTDDLILLDSANRQIQVITQSRSSAAAGGAEVFSLDTEGAPLAVLPMRLNVDALSDLVVLREGSSNISIVPSAPAQTFVVNSTGDDSICIDGGVCTLRGALSRTRINSGPDTITFNIPGNGPFTIAPQEEPLPAIDDVVTIDATTQAGYNGRPLIEIVGTHLSGEAGEGLTIFASNCVVRGLAINDFPSVLNLDGASQIGGNGILIASFANSPRNSNNIIEGNFLGLDPVSFTDKGNDATGLLIFDSDDNIIGGTVWPARNVMSGNGNEGENRSGVGLAIEAGNRNIIMGNYIGTDDLVTRRVGNSAGVFLSGKNNEFGGNEAGAGNVVSGNGSPSSQPGQCFAAVGNDGIEVAVLVVASTGELLTFDNNFRGNRIGTDHTGTVPLGNCRTGIIFSTVTRTIVGSITNGGRNIISGNDWDAIHCLTNSASSAGSCTIVGNNIGTDITGTKAIPNTARNALQFGEGEVLVSGTVWLFPVDGGTAVLGSPGGTTRWGACTGFCNLISGNGVNPFGGSVYTSGNNVSLIINNYIGTNRSGTAALANDNSGIHFTSQDIIGGIFNQNGSEVFGGNLISGNAGSGIWADSYQPNPINRIQGNLIGTSADGMNAIPNGGSGIVGNAQLIGGKDLDERNIIAGNKQDGILSDSHVETRIINNFIGVNTLGEPLGNGGNGISLSGRNTQVGGVSGFGLLSEGNVIQNNGGHGVLIFQAFGGAPTKNSVLGNSIAYNGRLGINLLASLDDEVTPNDTDPTDDADEGPNRLQNFPEIISQGVNDLNELVVSYRVRSAPANSDYGLFGIRVEFFKADPNGEGVFRVGFDNYTEADYNNGSPVTKEVNLGPTLWLGFTPNTDKVTATATDFQGNTSEFTPTAGSPFGNVQFSAADYTAGEGEGPVAITVTRKLPADGPVTVQYTDTSETATSGADYTNGTGTVTLGDGELAKTFTIPITNDAIQETDETFRLTLSIVSGNATLGLPYEATVTITDGAPTPTFQIGGRVADAGDAGLEGVTVTLSGTGSATVTTGTDGKYLFNNAQAGGTYTVMPSKTGFSFTPPSRTFENLSADQTAEFTANAVATNGEISISEFRLRGPSGAQDEFIELYNATDASITAGATDGSSGWAVATSDGIVRAVIPAGVIIPARGHYLVVGAAYSLASYATADANFVSDLPDDMSLALFNTANTANFSASTLLDAVGFTGASTPYVEGTPLAPIGASSGEYSFVRKLALTGLPRDKGDNAADFAFISTDGGIYGGVHSELGAPGPQNAASPIQRNTLVKGALIDTGCAGNGAATTACGRVRDTTPDSANNSTLGTLSIRRKFTNNTGAHITSLRFRVVDITSAPQAVNNGTADLRLRTSTTILGATLSGGGTTTIQGLTLEQGPNQPNGGGLNSTVSAGTITFAAPLAPGASINVHFLLGVQQSGAYRIYVNVEALP